jgi:hypothetical protein
MTNRLKKESILKRPIAFNKPFSVIFNFLIFFTLKNDQDLKWLKDLKNGL